MKKKILVVDDEPDMIGLISMRLEAANYEVITAYDGEEALEKVIKEKPDLIILDALLPKLSGFQVCRQLKNDAKYSEIPIILLSALTSKQDIETAKALKANAYITKPFKSKDLLKTITDLIGS